MDYLTINGIPLLYLDGKIVAIEQIATIMVDIDQNTRDVIGSRIYTQHSDKNLRVPFDPAEIWDFIKSNTE